MKSNCINCNKEITYSPSNRSGKYCNNKCQMMYQHKTITLPLIESGMVKQAGTLKKFLKEKDGAICKKCGCGEMWNNIPLTLQLDHIDGNSDNNIPSNLRLLCPNCHSQTDTYGSKGVGARYQKKSNRNIYLRKYKGYENTK